MSVITRRIAELQSATKVQCIAGNTSVLNYICQIVIKLSAWVFQAFSEPSEMLLRLVAVNYPFGTAPPKTALWIAKPHRVGGQIQLTPLYP